MTEFDASCPDRLTPDQVEDSQYDVRGWQRSVMCWSGISLLLAAIVLSVLSLSDTGDTPCGSLLDPNFAGEAMWNTVGQCGLVHLGTAVLAGSLVLTGVALLVVAGGSRSRRSRFATALIFIKSVTAIAAVGTIVLTGRASTYPEPVLRRGWTSLRNVAGGVTVLLLVATTANQFSTVLGRSINSERPSR